MTALLFQRLNPDYFLSTRPMGLVILVPVWEKLALKPMIFVLNAMAPG